MTHKYSVRIIGVFEDQDYGTAQTAVIQAFSGLTNGKLQSIELSQWEQSVEDTQDMAEEDSKAQE